LLLQSIPLLIWFDRSCVYIHFRRYSPFVSIYHLTGAAENEETKIKFVKQIRASAEGSGIISKIAFNSDRFVICFNCEDEEENSVELMTLSINGDQVDTLSDDVLLNFPYPLSDVVWHGKDTLRLLSYNQVSLFELESVSESDIESNAGNALTVSRC
jgi:hypothetical protein